MNLATFLSINAPAAAAASEALAKLTRRSASVKLLNAKLLSSMGDHPPFDREEIVSGVYLPITGGLPGAALLCFQEEKVSPLIEMLRKTKVENPSRLTELEESALKELGNIICGNYVTALSNALRVRILPGVPHFTRAMFGSMLEEVVARLPPDARGAVLVDVEIDLPSEAMLGYLLLCFEPERLIDV